MKLLAATCDFGENLEEMLRDRFIQGISNSETQHKLLTDPELTFQRAVEIAKGQEAATKEVVGMGNGSAISVNKIHSNANTNKNDYVESNKFSSNNKYNSSSNSGQSRPSSPCSGCGGKHWKRDCPFKDAECFKCKRKGHIMKVCGNNKVNNNNRAENFHSTKDYTHYTREQEYELFNISIPNKVPPINVEIIVNNKVVQMELDTGAARSIMPEVIYHVLWPVSSERPELIKSSAKLRTYGGTGLSVLGELFATIQAGSLDKNRCQGNIIIVRSNSIVPCLLGTDLIEKLNLNKIKLSDIHKVMDNEFVSGYPDLFSPGLGYLKDTKVKIEVDPNVSPKYCRARTVPYAIREELDKELSRLESEGIINPITNSKWAAAVVPVSKSDNSIRVCGDYRLTANKAARLDTYPIPKLSNLFSSLGGGCFFSKLDMSQACAQLELDEDSKEYAVINTQKGLFRYNRLCFGISSAPGIFQREMERLFRNYPGVFCYLDDILISASNLEEHNSRVNDVLTKLQESGLKLRADKCCFGVSQINYLGYKIDKEGLHPTEAKIKAIRDAPTPVNQTQLRAYLGLLNFYRRFLPKAATTLESLNKLLRDKQPWIW